MMTIDTIHGPRSLGRDTASTVRNWDAIAASMPVAPRIFGSAGLATPRKSPNIRRFHYDAFQDQRQRGFCVGFNTVGTIKTRLRIPLGATSTSGDPLPEVMLSPIYTYDVARLECAAEGWMMGQGDGAIGSCAARGSSRWGVCDLDDDPATEILIDSHRNDSRPPAQAQAFGMRHVVKAFALADSWEHGLELNAAGIPLAVCSEIPESMLTTSADGSFRMVGVPVGGHCYQLIDHDQDRDLAWIGQSWANWGEQCPDPRYRPRSGFTQIGTCSLTDLSAWFSGQRMASGSAEIIAYNTVDGFAPPIIDYGAWD